MIIKKLTTLVAVTALSLGGMVACSSTSAEDSGITKSVESNITNDPMLHGSKLDVKTKEGVVTLKGTVENSAQEEAAKKAAESVQGVKNVELKLTVKNASPAASSTTSTTSTTTTPAAQ